MANTWANVDDLREAESADWFSRAKADTESFLRGFGWTGGSTRTAEPVAPFTLPSVFTQSDEEYRKSAPWRDLDPTPEPASMTATSPRPTAASGTPAAMPTTPEGGPWRGPADVGESTDPGIYRGGGEIDNSSRQAFVRSAWPHMLQAAGGNRDAAEMMLAAAISENGSIGTGRPIWANNFFGIKGRGDAGSANAATWEQTPNGPVHINDDFAAYSSPVAGFGAFFDFLRNNSRYASALQRYQQSGDASQLFRDVNTAGYATDPAWASKVENIRANQVAPIVRTQNAGAAPDASPSSPPAPAPPTRSQVAGGDVPPASQMPAGRSGGAGVMQRQPMDDPGQEVDNGSFSLDGQPLTEVQAQQMWSPDQPAGPQYQTAAGRNAGQGVRGRINVPTGGPDTVGEMPSEQAPAGGYDDPGTQPVQPYQGPSPDEVRQAQGEVPEPGYLQQAADWVGRTAQRGAGQVMEHVVSPALAALDAANEWRIANPVLGSLSLQGMGRELQGWQQIEQEVGEDTQRLQALVARKRAGDDSVDDEITALTASLNRRMETGRPLRERLLEAGERNPNKTAETMGGLAEGALATALAPSAGAGVVRNVAAAALDPIGQGSGLVPEAVVGAGRAAARGARALTEAPQAERGVMQLGSGVVPEGAGALPGSPPRSIERAVEEIRSRRTDADHRVIQQAQASAAQKLEQQAAIKEQMKGRPTNEINAAIKEAGAALTKQEEAARIGFTGQEEVADVLREGQVIPSQAVAGMLGQFPSYLRGVTDFIVEQRQKLVSGTLTPRDVAKAYIHTVGSMQAGAQSRVLLERKLGRAIGELFVDQGKVRPEEAIADWFFTPAGKRALDAIENGTVDREAWDDLLAMRDSFGNNTLRNMGVFGPKSRTTGQIEFDMPIRRAPDGSAREYDIRNIGELTDAINAAHGDTVAIMQAIAKVKGIGAAKPGFIKHLLGLGNEATFDAVEMNLWLTGRGDTGTLRGPAADMARAAKLYSDNPEVTRLLFDQIRARFDELRAAGVGSEIDPAVFNHVMHHWIWDRAKGLQTTHAGMYEAMRHAANAAPVPSSSFRSDLANAAQGAFVGAASEDLQANQEGREPDMTERLARAAGGAALGIGAGRMMRGQGAQRVGSGMVPQRQTVEVLQQRLEQARNILARAHETGDPTRIARAQDNLAAIESDLIDARNARLDLEPRIASDVGRRVDDLPLSEESADAMMDARLPRERYRGSPDELSGPVSLPANRGREMLGSGFVPADDAPRYDPRLAREPVLPGLEPPRTPPKLIDEAGDAAARAEMRAGGTALPGMERLAEDRFREPRLLAREPDSNAVKAAEEMRATKSAGLPDMTPQRSVMRHVADAIEPIANKVNIIRYAGMLSDTAGHAFNAASNLALQFGDVANTAASAVIDAGRVGAARAARRPVERAVFFHEIPARIGGQWAGAKAGLQAAGDIMRTGINPNDASKLDHTVRGFESGSARLDTVAEFPLRALAAADAIFRGAASGGHMAAEGYAAARRANKTRDVTPEMVREALKNPELLGRIEKMAARSVLQEDRALTDWYKHALRYEPKDPAAKLVVDAAKAAISAEVPFVRTPFNVMAQGMGMTPAGLIGAIRAAKAGRGPREVQQRLAQVALGTGIMAAASVDYSAGNLTGPYPSDQAEASTLPPGWRPWSRKVEVGGETYYVPLAATGPYAVPAVAAILSAEAQKKGKDVLSSEWAGAVALGIGRYAVQQTFFDGVTRVAKVFDERTGEANIEKHVEQIAQQFAPYGGFGREVQRIMGLPSRDPEGALEALLAMYPGTSEQVRPRQDVLGREQSMGVSGPAGAFVRAGVENDDPVIASYRNAAQSLPMAAPRRITDPATKQEIALDIDQRAEWERAFGQALQSRWASAGYPFDARGLESVKGKASEDARRRVLGR